VNINKTEDDIKIMQHTPHTTILNKTDL